MKLTSRIGLYVAGCSVILGCGGTTKPTDNSVGPGESSTSKSNTQDFVFGDWNDTQKAQVNLNGLRFEPQALVSPSMRVVERPGARKPSLAKQRRIAARAKPNAKVAETQILASLLWKAAKPHFDEATKHEREASSLDAQAAAIADADKKNLLKADAQKARAQGAAARQAGQPFREEARKVLRELVAAIPPDGDAGLTTLRMLAAAEATLGDNDKAIKAYGMIAEKYPNAEGVGDDKAWHAYLLLISERLSDAGKAVAAWTLEPSLSPIVAYVAAWTHYRLRKYDNARKYMEVAARNWKTKAGRAAVAGELKLLYGRAGTPVATAKPVLAELAQKSTKYPKSRLFEWLYNLNQAYLFAGFYQQAAEALVASEQAYETKAGTRLAFRLSLADYARRTNEPAKAAKWALEAHKVLAECSECTDADKLGTANRLAFLATQFHTIYAYTLDDKFYPPAKELYKFYLERFPEGADVAKLSEQVKQLEQTKSNANPAQGKHDANVMWNYVAIRREVAIACYESVLQGEPKLSGEVTVTIQVDQAGTVSGVTTDPAKGLEGISAVAGCLDERIRSWTFPSRTIPGTTAVQVPFKFSPKATQ